MIMHFSAALMPDVRIKTDHIQTNSQREKDELELSSVFASLGVLKHEVLAVAVKEDFWTKPYEPVHAILTSTPVPSTPPVERMNGVFTQNPRFDDRKASSSTKPMLSTPDVPSQFKEFEEERKKLGDFDDISILNKYIDDVLHSQG